MSDSLIYTILGIDRASPAFDSAAKSAKSLADRLDGFGKAGVASLGLVAAAGAASSVAIGAALAGTTLAFAGLAIAAQASNERVSNSFIQLSDEVQDSVKAMTEPLVPQIEAVAGKMAATFNQLEPLMARGFGASSAHIDTLSDALSDFALNSMPGVVRSVQRAHPVMEGLRELAESTGTGLSQFFDELSGGADSAGSVLGRFGALIRDLLPRIGALIRDLSNNFDGAFDGIANAIIGLVDAIGGLAGGALPVMSTALQVFAGAINGALTVLGPFSEILGGLTGVMLSAAAAWKVLVVATAGIQGAVSGIGKFGDKVGDAMKSSKGFASALGGVSAALGGPWGLALGAAAAGLAVLGLAQESAAESASEHAEYIEAMTDALRDSNGVMDENARKVAAGTAEVKEAVDAAKQFGFSSEQIIDAALGQGDAIDVLRGKLQSLIESNKVYATQEPTNELAWTGAYTDQGNAALDLLNKLDALNGGTRTASSAALDFGQAMQLGHRSMLETSAAGKSLTEAVGILGSALNDLDKKAQAAKQALDALSGADISLEQSQAKVNDQLMKLGEMFDGAGKKAAGFGAALLNQDGTINTTTKNGQALLSTMVSLRDSTAETAAKTFQLAIDSGDTLPAALAKAEAVVARSRNEFVKQRKEMGFSEKQAKALADQFDLFPDAVSVALLTPYLSETQRELLSLQAKLDKAKVGAKIPVTSLSDEAQRKLEHLGFTVQRLPNGKVTVTANSEQALAEFRRLTKTEYKTIQVTVREQRIYENYARNVGGSGSFTRALGGPVEAGRPYWVGEYGPELVFPSRSGWVATASESDRIASAMRDGLTIGPGGSLVGTTPRGPALTTGGSRGMSVTVNVNGAREPMIVAEEIRRKLLTLKRDMGGASLGLA